MTFFNKISNFFAATAIIYAFWASDAAADESYPESFAVRDIYEGGALVLTGDYAQPEKYRYTYFIKPNWVEESDALHVWRGADGDSSAGRSIGAANIYAAYPLEKTILFAFKENDELFAAHLDERLEVRSFDKLSGEFEKYLPVEAEWIGETMSGSYLLQVNQYLYNCYFNDAGEIKTMIIAEDVLGAVAFPPNQASERKYPLAYLAAKESINILYFADLKGNVKFGSQTPVSDLTILQPLHKGVASLTSSRAHSQSLMQAVEAGSGPVANAWIQAAGDRIIIVPDSAQSKIYYLQYTGAYYSMILSIYQDYSIKKTNNADLPEGLIEPIGVWAIEDRIYALFRNGIASFSLDGDLLAIDYIPFGEIFSVKPRLFATRESLLVSTRTTSLALKREENRFWFVYRFLKTSGKIVLPAALIIIIVIVAQIYRRQKRLMRAIIDLRSIGAVFVIDKRRRLILANAAGKEALGVGEGAPLGRIFSYYCSLEHTKPILELIEKAFAVRETIRQKINIVKNSDVNEWLCTVIPLQNITGNFKGAVFTGVDITEQLERNRLANWAQLAHDMQTNLSTIRLNAEQIVAGGIEINESRRKKIIHQVNLLIQRVRDVVTVGRSSSIERTLVSAPEICREAREEFDEVMFPNVAFEIDAKNFMVSCDKAKMVRAVRNAIENAIKAFKGDVGKIIISCRLDARRAIISVKDNGPGMDEKTKAKILKPYFTTAKKGGHGIGTMIMQQVMELHGGEIILESKQGVGTEVIFSFPNVMYGRNPNKKKRSE